MEDEETKCFEEEALDSAMERIETIRAKHPEAFAPPCPVCVGKAVCNCDEPMNADCEAGPDEDLLLL